MIRTFMAAGLAVVLLAVPISADEQVNTGYSVALGYSIFVAEGVGDTGGVIACLGPPEQEICEDAGIDPIGGFGATPTGSGFTHFEITVTDALSSSNVFIGVCVYSDDHSICATPEDPVPGEDYRIEGCGIPIEGDPINPISSATPVVGFVYTASLDATTNQVCIGTSGDVSAVYT